MNNNLSDYVTPKNYFLLGVKLVIMNAQGEILVLKRSEKLPRPGGWDFPGGAVDAGESPELAAIREVYEETGIVITDPKIFTSALVTESTDYAVILGFSTEVRDTHVTLSWEHDEYKWITVDDLVALDLAELHQKILDIFLKLTSID